MDATLRILVVDDSAVDALLTTMLIERDRPADHRVQITRADSVGAAKHSLGSTPFDCILLDWNLPDSRQDSIGALQSVAPAVPIVVLSGLEDPIASQKALDQGAKAFVIKKPLSQSEDLFALLSQVTGTSAACKLQTDSDA